MGLKHRGQTGQPSGVDGLVTQLLTYGVELLQPIGEGENDGGQPFAVATRGEENGASDILQVVQGLAWRVRGLGFGFGVHGVEQSVRGWGVWCRMEWNTSLWWGL